jgi:simple sugar transport system substrate-binding protein
MTKRLKFHAVTHDILGDVFWEVFRRGLFDAAARYDVEVEHLRPGKFSPEIQARLIGEAVAQRPDGLISTVPDVAAVDGPLRHAMAAGIPLICVNAADPRGPGERIPYLCYIGGDDGNAGELAGRYILGRTGGKPGLCVDHYLYDHICHNERWTGFQRAFATAGVPVERLRVPGGDPAKCAALVAAHLAARREIGAVLTLGPPGAEAVLAAGEGRPAAGSPSHVTFDLAETQIAGIRSGRILATIDSQQYLQAYLAVEWLWLHKVHGFTPAADIHTGPAIVDLSNVDRAADGVRRGVR